MSSMNRASTRRGSLSSSLFRQFGRLFRHPTACRSSQKPPLTCDYAVRPLGLEPRTCGLRATSRGFRAVTSCPRKWPLSRGYVVFRDGLGTGP